DINAVPNFELIHVRTDLLYNARAVVAWCVRQRRLPCIRSGANVSLHRVHADRMHSNEQFTWTWPRRRGFLHAKNLRAPELMDSHRFHDSVLTCLDSNINSAKQVDLR